MIITIIITMSHNYYYNISSIPIEIISAIINDYDINIIDQLAFCGTCRTYYMHIIIYHLDTRYVDSASFIQSRFSTIKSLRIKNKRAGTPEKNVEYNFSFFTQLTKLTLIQTINIENISYLTKLKTLKIENGNANIIQNEMDTLINLLSLTIYNNDHIKNLTCLSHLTKLRSPYCIMNINGLTNLTYLDIRYCKIYIDISQFTNLRTLNIEACTNINQDNIMNLTQLTSLNINRNKSVNNIAHLSNLTELHADYQSAITQNSIDKLFNLKYLYCHSNNKITNMNHLTNLVYLNTYTYYAMRSPDIGNVYNLRTLKIPFYESVCDNIKYFTNLTDLDASGYSSEINQDIIQRLTNLTTLDIHCNKNITNVTHLWQLTKLIISSTEKITSLENLINLTHLNISDVMYITKIDHLTKLTTLNLNDNAIIKNISTVTKLTHLDICGTSCAIDQDNINNLYLLRKLPRRYNNKITSTEHLTRLKKKYQI